MWKRLWFASRERIQDGVKVFLEVLGASWLAFELLTWITSDLANGHRGKVVLGAAFASAVAAWVKTAPKLSTSKYFASCDVSIELRKGNILEPIASDIALLATDHFDTCMDTVISPKSLIGKLITENYGGNKLDVDAQVDRALKQQNIASLSTIKDRSFGTNRLDKYPMGSVAPLHMGAYKAHIVAGTQFDGKSTMMDHEHLWNSLMALWRSIANNGKKPIAVPVWGSSLANGPGNRVNLFLTMLSSFAAFVAQEGRPTAKLIIVVWDADYKPSEFNRMSNILTSFEV